MTEHEIMVLEELKEKVKTGYYICTRYSKQEYDAMIEAGTAPTENVVEEKGVSKESTFVVYSCKYTSDYTYQEYLLAKQIELLNSQMSVLKIIRNGIFVLAFLITLWRWF